MITFINDSENGTRRIEISIHEFSTISECTEAFEDFLRASGYVFDGIIDIVPSED